MNRRNFFSIVLGTCTGALLPKKAKVTNSSQTGIKKRKNLEFVMDTEDNAPIVAMVELNNEMWVATTKEVWVYQRDYPIKAHS